MKRQIYADLWTTEIKRINFVVICGLFIIYYDKYYVYVMNYVLVF